MGKQRHRLLEGTLYAVAAFIMWGALPIYWRSLQHVPPSALLAYRIILTFLFTLVLTWTRGHLTLLGRAFADRKHRFAIAACAITLTGNWFFFLYAVVTNHLVEASLGYYINPLLSVIFGVLFLKERLGFYRFIALIVAGSGVTTLAVAYGHVPWISLLIALCFGIYGLIKKASGIDSRISITAESMVLTPFAVAFLLVTSLRGGSLYLDRGAATVVLLLLSGFATALPLIWFSKAAETIPLSRVGFIQYLTPTAFLLLGVGIYHEGFSLVQLIAFGCIWTALALFSLADTRLLRRAVPPAFRSEVGSSGR